MQLCKYVILIVALPLLLKPNIGKSDNQQELKPLDEEFLLFLAEMTITEDESIDPLNMLDIDSDALELDELSQVSLKDQITPDNKIIMKQNISAKEPTKEDQ